MGICTLEHIKNVKDKLILVIMIYKLWAVHDRGFYIVYKSSEPQRVQLSFVLLEEEFPSL